MHKVHMQLLEPFSINNFYAKHGKKIKSVYILGTTADRAQK